MLPITIFECATSAIVTKTTDEMRKQEALWEYVCVQMCQCVILTH